MRWISTTNTTIKTGLMQEKREKNYVQKPNNVMSEDRVVQVPKAAREQDFVMEKYVGSFENVQRHGTSVRAPCNGSPGGRAACRGELQYCFFGLKWIKKISMSIPAAGAGGERRRRNQPTFATMHLAVRLHTRDLILKLRNCLHAGLHSVPHRIVRKHGA